MAEMYDFFQNFFAKVDKNTIRGENTFSFFGKNELISVLKTLQTS